jgi:hypothetical protein
VLTGEGLKYNMEVTNISELYRNVLELFHSFNPAKEILLMLSLLEKEMQKRLLN